MTDRQTIIRACKRVLKNHKNEPIPMAFESFQELLDVFETQPEIVRCKDCKFFIGEGHYCKVRGLGRALKPDDYCSDGERQERR